MSERKFRLFRQTADGKLDLTRDGWIDFTAPCDVATDNCPVYQEIKPICIELNTENTEYEYSAGQPKMPQNRIVAELPNTVCLADFQEKCKNCKLGHTS